MYDDLFDLMLDGAFANKKEFDNFVNEATPEEIFSLVIEGAFTDIDEFKSMYNVDLPEVKKKDEAVSTPQPEQIPEFLEAFGTSVVDEPVSTSQEEVTESITPTEQEEVGSLESSAPSPLEERRERERIKAEEYQQESQFDERAEFDINEDARASLQQSVEIVDRGDYRPSTTQYKFEDKSNVIYAPIDVRTSGYNNNIKQIENLIESSKKELLKIQSTFRGVYPPHIEKKISDRKQLLNKYESDLKRAKEQYEKDKEYTASLIGSESGSLKEKQQLESKAYDEMSLEDKMNLGTRQDPRFTEMEDPNLVGPQDLSLAELEVQSIFSEKGYDYKQVRDDFNVYKQSQKEIEFIESAPLYIEELTKEEKKLYADKYYINGTRREDIKTFIPDLQTQVDERFDFVIGDEYQRLQEDADAIIEKRYQKEASEAASNFKLLQKNLGELNERSIATLGVPISDINKLEFTSQESVDEANKIIDEANTLNATQDLIAEQYVEASTWYDVKFDKELTGDIVENWEGFTNNLSVGWNRGQAAEEILKSALGFSDLGDEATLEEVANAIVEYSKRGQTGKTNRTLERWAKANGWSEGWSAFSDNWFEMMVTMTGESLFQMAPYALKMVAIGGGVGFGTGAAIGATGLVTGPGGLVTTGAGAVAGLGYGVKTSMAAAAYSMEYTNSVFEAMANQDPDFDITDPASVQKGLTNPKVWEEGFEIGTKRGIPIAVVEYLSAGLAGKFLTAGRLASKPLKVGAFVAERALFDSGSEAFGEFMAQIVSGQEVDMKEIISEAIGSMGTLAPVALFNIAKDTRSFNKITIAQDLATIDGMANESASPQRITNWANNMEKAGKITAEQNQRIQENIGLKREAQDAFVRQSYFTEKSAPQARMMELLRAKRELSSNANRRAAFKDKIKEIDAEIAGLIGEENLKPIEQQTNFPSIINDGFSGRSDVREGISRYRYKGKDITREELDKKIDKISLRGLLKLRINKDDKLQEKLDKRITELGADSGMSKEEIKKIAEEASPTGGGDAGGDDVKTIEQKKLAIEKAKQEAKDNPVKEPDSYTKAVNEYKQTDLGGGEEAKVKKDKVVEESQTEEGKAYVKNVVAQLEYNEDGTITLYRSGTIQDGNNPATTSKKIAETIAKERKKQGLSSDIVEVRVNPEDISAVIPGVEKEVFIEVNENNKSRILDNTKEEQRTSKELLSEKNAVEKELEKIEESLKRTDKAIEEGTDSNLPAIIKNKPKIERKIKNLKYQLEKYNKKISEQQEVEDLESIVGKEKVSSATDTAPAGKREVTKEEKELIDNIKILEDGLASQEYNIEDKATIEENLKELKTELAEIQAAPAVKTVPAEPAVKAKVAPAVKAEAAPVAETTPKQQSAVEKLRKGKMTTTKPLKIYKGIGGKKDIRGQRINAHKGVKGIFSAVDKKLAEEYGREEGVSKIDLPAGVTIEVVQLDTKGLDPKQYRAAEVKAINESDAQVVKLITIEGKVKGLLRNGDGKQQQYIIKDFDLVPELKRKKRAPAVETELKKEAEKVEAELEEMDSDELKEESKKAKSATKIKEKARQLAKEILRNKKRYREFINEVGDSSSDMAKFIAVATTDYINGKTNEIVERYSEVKKKIEKIVRDFKKGVLIALFLSGSIGVVEQYYGQDVVNYINEEIIPEAKALPSYIERGLVKEFGLDVEESVAPDIVEEIVEAEVNEVGETTVTLPDSKIHSVIDEKRDGRGVKLSQHSNYFNNEDGFVYNPIPETRNRKAPKQVDGVATAHFFILDKRPDDFKDIYDADNKELKRQSEWFKNQGSLYKNAKDTDFFPVIKKTEEGGVFVQYKRKSEITENDFVIQKLVQNKASDIDFSNFTSADKQYEGIKGSKLAKEYPDYSNLQTKDGERISSVIFKNDSLYSKFSGAAGLFIAETPDGKRFIKDFSGSVKNMKDGLKSFAEITGVKEGDITIAFYDAGSVTAKPAGKNGKINRAHASSFNPKTRASSGLAFPVGFETQSETKVDKDIPQFMTGKDTSSNQRTERLAPNGKRSNLTDVQYDTVRTKAFKNWFGDWETDPANASKVVDENGEPMVMYHGTYDKFNEFIYGDKLKEEYRKLGYYTGYNNQFGTHFGDIATAKRFAEDYEDGILIPVFLNIKDPLETPDLGSWESTKILRHLRDKNKWDVDYKAVREDRKSGTQVLNEELSKKGVDGFVYENYIEGGGVNSYITFESNQSKLADGTNTTFDPSKQEIDLQLTQEDSDVKQGLISRAKELMKRLQDKMAKDPVEVKEPAVSTIPIQIVKGSNLYNLLKKTKLGAISLNELVGKKINLVMADQLTTQGKYMGGPMFPFIKSLFGRVAWASMSNSAASSIINGAIDSDYSVVFNMSPTAIYSNKAFRDEILSKLDKEKQAELYQLIIDSDKIGSVKKEQYAIDNSNNLVEFFNLLDNKVKKFNVEDKINLFNKMIPSEGVEATEDIFKFMQDNDLNIEQILPALTEEFVKDLPMGALTMILEVQDKSGNKITKKTKKEAFISREEQKAEGMETHDNYEVYIRGTVLGMLKDTLPFWEVLPSYKEIVKKKIAGIIKSRNVYTLEGEKLKVLELINEDGSRSLELKDGKESIKNFVISKTSKVTTEKYIKRNIKLDVVKRKEGGVFTAKQARAGAYSSAMKGASRSEAVTEPTKSEWTKLIDKLKNAFPNTEVVATQKEFDELLKNLNAKSLSTKNQTIYGAVYQGKLYLNPAVENFNTPVHEFGHIWINTVKQVKPELYNKGLDLIQSEGSQYVEDVRNSADYKRVIKEMRKQGVSEEDINTYILEEALATAIGDQGEAFTEAAKSSFKSWLNELFDFIKKLTGISKVTSEQLSNMTLEEFTQAVVVDLLSGEELFQNMQVDNLNEQIQLMTSPNLTMEEVILIGRQEEFSDSVIRKLLKKRGFKVADIDAAMEVVIDKDTSLPIGFMNVEGGVMQAVELFKSLRNDLAEFSKGVTVVNQLKPLKGVERNKRIKSLRNKFKEDKALSDTQLLRKHPRRSKQTTYPTKAEVRAKAQELLKSHPIYKKQTEQVQKELILSFDKTLNTRANKTIQTQINNIKTMLKQRTVGAKNLKKAQIVLKNYIRRSLIKSSTYSQADINKLIRLVADIDTVAEFYIQAEKVQEVVEKQRKISKKNSLTKLKKTIEGKKKSSSLDAKGKSLMSTINRFARKIINVKPEVAYKAIADEKKFLDDNRGKIESIYTKLIINNEKISRQEQRLIDRKIAFDLLSNINNMTLEEVNVVNSLIKELNKESAGRLQEKQEANLAVELAQNKEASEQIAKTNPDLFDKDGNPVSNTMLQSRREKVQRLWRDKKFPQAFIAWAEKVKSTGLKGSIAETFYNHATHLRTLVNLLDRTLDGLDTFKENITTRLNGMEESKMRGVRDKRRIMDKMAVDAGFNSYNSLIRFMGSGIFTEKVYTYDVLTGGKIVDVTKNGEKVGRKMEGGERVSKNFTVDELLRVYALYKNETQREKLIAQGFDATAMAKVETQLGPKLTKFADSMVQYMSTVLYEEINEVYSDVNDVNLRQIENYFPTRTQQESVTANLIISGEFFDIFQQETVSALESRVDTENEVLFDTSFTAVVENHIDTTEKYKAYARGVKLMNSFFNNPSVEILISELGVKGALKRLITDTISPDASMGIADGRNIVKGTQSKFLSWSLSVKFAQIIKQASSFIYGFTSYRFLPEKSKLKGAQLPLDILGFIMDLAILSKDISIELAAKGAKGLGVKSKRVSRAAEQGPISQTRELSLTFDERIAKGLEGDIFALETGIRRNSRPSKKTAYAKAKRGKRKALGSFTSIGDIGGVLGYLVAYRRDIANGMSEEAAIEKFNDYNITQQTKRGTERVPIQNSKNALLQSFIMFSSALILAINNAAMSSLNIKRALIKSTKLLSKGKIRQSRAARPRAKDLRMLFISVSLANTLFAIISNAYLLMKGDDDDVDKAYARIVESMLGLNLLYTIPFLGSEIEKFDIGMRFMAYYRGKDYKENIFKRLNSSVVVNPIEQFSNKVYKDIKDEDILGVVKSVAELRAGVNVDPAVGFYDVTVSEEDDVNFDTNIAKTLGISPGSRPKEITPEDIKKQEEEAEENRQNIFNARRKRDEENMPRREYKIKYAPQIEAEKAEAERARKRKNN